MAPLILKFRSQKELQAFVTKHATPIAKRMAQKEARAAVYEATSFRKKKESASPQSSIELQNRFGGAGNAITIVSGSRSDGHGDIPALTSLLSVLDSMGLIDNQTT